jgi:hypothetical protein
MAKAEVSRRRRMLEEATAKAEEADRVAKEYAAKRPAEEAALFEKIKNLVLERKRLDRYHDEIAALRQHELELFDLAEQEWQKVRDAEAALAQAINAHKEAVRDVSKFEEHRNIWWTAEKRRLEEIQELEAEETAGTAALRKKNQ